VHHPSAHLTHLFLIANVVIAAGYAAIPVLVLPYLPLTRTAMVFGAGFLLGCAGTHLWMVLGDHHHGGWFWTGEHLVQAICTWGFIITFHRMLRAAGRQRRSPPAPSAPTGEAHGRDQLEQP
jgi:hypothetical protein